MRFTRRTGRIAILRKWKTVHEKQLAYLHKNKLKSRTDLIKIHSYLASDGCVCLKNKDGKRRYEIRFYPDSLPLAEDFVSSFSIVYGMKPPIKLLKNHFKVGIKNKIAFLHLQKYGKFTSLDWKIPKEVIKERQLKIEWLRCFIDCDGHISKRGILQIQSVNEKGIIGIKNIFSDLHIPSTLTEYQRKNKNWNKNYILTINKRNINKVQRIFKLLHPQKQERLQNADVA